jgi:hypothetical protein
VRFIGRKACVLLHASEAVVCGGRIDVARHECLATRGGSRLNLDHYLEGLLRKPGALSALGDSSPGFIRGRSHRDNEICALVRVRHTPPPDTSEALGHSVQGLTQFATGRQQTWCPCSRLTHLGSA